VAASNQINSTKPPNWTKNYFSAVTLTITNNPFTTVILFLEWYNYEGPVFANIFCLKTADHEHLICKIIVSLCWRKGKESLFTL